MLTMASSSTTAIASGALVLAGCAVGILLGRWTAVSSPASEHNTETGALQADLRPAMAEIQRTSETILQTIQARGNTPPFTPSQRESATFAPDNLDRLTTAIETLNALLQTNGGRVGGRSPAIEKWKGPGFPTLDALWTRVHQIARANDPDWGEKFDSEMRQAHLAWTREDLFERYGAPTILNAKDRGLELGYQRKLEEDAIESIAFLVADDLVVYIYYDG
jgi:outer membrane murein-binding lipoprotein Lpp